MFVLNTSCFFSFFICLSILFSDVSVCLCVGLAVFLRAARRAQSEDKMIGRKRDSECSRMTKNPR